MFREEYLILMVHACMLSIFSDLYHSKFQTDAEDIKVIRIFLTNFVRIIACFFLGTYFHLNMSIRNGEY